MHVFKSATYNSTGSAPLSLCTNVIVSPGCTMGLVMFSMWEMWARVAVIWRNRSAVSLEPATATILY